jgi:hypothetical protein
MAEVAAAPTNFLTNLRKLLDDIDFAKDLDNRIKICLRIYQSMNKDLNKFVQTRGINKLIIFIRVNYFKILEFETEYNIGKWNKIDKQLVDNFIIEFTKTKKYLIHLIKLYYGEDNWEKTFNVLRAKEDQANEEQAKQEKILNVMITEFNKNIKIKKSS